jgi:hypothetical protein
MKTSGEIKNTTQHILTTATDCGEWAAAYALAPLTPHPRK